MRRIRIHVDRDLAPGDELDLPEAAAAHVARVLRLRAGDEVTLFNGDGADYPAALLAVERGRARARIADRVPAATESPLPLVLAQALARGDKMDFVVQKAVELGVAGVVPLVTERSEVRLDAVRGEKRMERWRAVIASACEQCGRAQLPYIAPPQPLAEWTRGLAADGSLRLALLPGSGQRVRDLRLPAAGAIVAVGPEGGFGDRDVALLTGAGFSGLDLGPRILRTETAGLAALAALQACHGDW